MSSAALGRWTTDRTTRLNNLLASHRAVSGSHVGRRRSTEKINHALILRLASEFQGFVRDLHDECVEVVIIDGASSAQFVTIARASLRRSRKLDSGNANWANICDDFSRFGVSLSSELRARNARRYVSWVQKLSRLNAARNAIAHEDRIALASCTADQPLTLRTYMNCRSALGAMASGIDHAIGEYLSDTIGARP